MTLDLTAGDPNKDNASQNSNSGASSSPSAAPGAPPAYPTAPPARAGGEPNYFLSRERAWRLLPLFAKEILNKRYPNGDFSTSSIIDALTWKNPADFVTVDCDECGGNGAIWVDGPSPW